LFDGSLNRQTGVPGVYRTRFGTYYAQVSAEGRNQHLGCYPDIESARLARAAAMEALGRPVTPYGAPT
jgi:hypothetical protein